MKDSLVGDRLRRAGSLADNKLTRLDRLVPSRGKHMSMAEYLPQALQRAKNDEQFAEQLQESLQRYASLKKIVWGGNNGPR